MRRIGAAIVATLVASCVLGATRSGVAQTDRAEVVKTYVDIGQAGYEDALARARVLQKTVHALVAAPSERTLQVARETWISAREPYVQTEVFRFGNAIVDDWEGKVNSWPLDEGLIDYVDTAKYGTSSDSNPYYTANVIANRQLKVGSKSLDASVINKKLLRDLQEIGDIEANVATGYHAIEFLLWGQDLNGSGPGAGDRPWTDYSPTGCTHGNCDRRAQYLTVATDLLVEDLAWMARQFAPGGQARKDLTKGRPDAGLTAMLTGLGSLSYGELAGERMKLGLMLHDPEEEHDCFSDNTHNSHYYDIVGMLNVYNGRYTRIDGRRVEGPSLAQLVAEASPDLAREVATKLETTLAAARRLKERAETKEHYDQMIGPDNPEGNAVVQAVIDALVDQTRSFERAIALLKLKSIKFEGSDSLDHPDDVGKEKKKK
jgi:putative iron-regulated protein